MKILKIRNFEELYISAKIRFLTQLKRDPVSYKLVHDMYQEEFISRKSASFASQIEAIERTLRCGVLQPSAANDIEIKLNELF